MANNITRSLLLAALLSVVANGHAQDDFDFLFGSDDEAETTAPDDERESASESADEDSQQSSDDAAADTSEQDQSDAPPETAEPEELDTIPVEQPVPQTAGRAPDDRRVIEEIVVTAQKTEQSLSDVPVSVTALQGNFIVDNAIGNLVEASTYVPNVRVEATSPTSPQVFIRGFGTNTFNPSFEPSVGLVQDEVFFARGSYFTQSMFDLERIEVLRGPQGTLFGKNTIAGVFNIVTRKAPAEGAESNVSVLRNNFDDQRIEAGLGTALSDGVGVRISLLEDNKAGRLFNSLLNRFEDEADQSAQRLRVDFENDGPLTWSLIGQRSDTRVNFWPRQLYNIDQDTFDYLSEFDPQIEDDPLNFQTSYNIPGFMNIDSYTVSGTAGYDIGPILGLDGLEGTVIVATSEIDVNQFQDLDTSPADLINLFGDLENYQQDSIELRFTGGGGAPFGLGTGSEFVGGVYSLVSEYAIITGIEAGVDLASYAATNDGQQLASGGALPGLPGGGIPAGVIGDIAAIPAASILEDDRYTFDFFQRNETLALFGQMTWFINEQWSVTPGLRYNAEKKTVDSAGFSSCQGKDAGQPCFTAALVNGQDYDIRNIVREETNVSPKISVGFSPVDGLNFFATAARGFKSGGVNSISFSGEDLEYEPETATSFELGVKSKLFGRSLNLNATAFRMDFDDLQVLAFNGFFFDVSNAASAFSQGIETDLLWLTPYRPLTVNASLGYLDAQYNEYNNAPAPISEGLNEQQDLAGRTLAFAPNWQATLTTTFEYTLFALPITLNANARYQDEQFTDTDLDPNTRVPPHTIYSASLRVASPSERWNLTIGGKNLTDKRVLNQGLDTALFPGVFLANQQPGRSGYVSFGLTW